MTMLSEMDFSCLGKFTKSPNMLAIFHLPTQFHRLLCCLGWKADPTNIEELPYLTVEFGQRGTPHRSGGEGRLGRLLMTPAFSLASHIGAGWIHLPAGQNALPTQLLLSGLGTCSSSYSFFTCSY